MSAEVARLRIERVAGRRAEQFEPADAEAATCVIQFGSLLFDERNHGSCTLIVDPQQIVEIRRDFDFVDATEFFDKAFLDFAPSSFQCGVCRRDVSVAAVVALLDFGSVKSELHFERYVQLVRVMLRGHPQTIFRSL
ncbi:MAG: hypothetical protein WD069_06005 [Planctomycetales bacterium]